MSRIKEKPTREYRLFVVKGDKEIEAPDGNITAQMISEVQHSLLQNKLYGRPIPAEHRELAEQLEKYPLTATDPQALMKGKNK